MSVGCVAIAISSATASILSLAGYARTLKTQVSAPASRIEILLSLCPVVCRTVTAFFDRKELPAPLAVHPLTHFHFFAHFLAMQTDRAVLQIVRFVFFLEPRRNEFSFGELVAMCLLLAPQRTPPRCAVNTAATNCYLAWLIASKCVKWVSDIVKSREMDIKREMKRDVESQQSKTCCDICSRPQPKYSNQL